jgi:flagellar basal-body rod protein FlgB
MARSDERRFRVPFFVTMTGLSDFTMQTASAALDGLSLRAKVRADNIANAETPGYRARRVDFESALRAAGGDITGVEFTERDANTAVDIRGNSVDLEAEVTELVQDNLMFQAMVNGFNYKANLLRTAMGS